MITLLPETDQRRLDILHLLSRQIGWLTVEEIAALDEAAAKHDLSRSEAIRAALARFAA